MVYHVNPESGESGVCRAEKGGCPWDKERVGANHYETAAEANAAGNKILVETYGEFSTQKKKANSEDVFEGAKNLRGGLGFLPIGTKVRFAENSEQEYTVRRNNKGNVVLISKEGYHSDLPEEILRKNFDIVGGIDEKEIQTHIKLGELGRERKALDDKITNATKKAQEALKIKGAFIRVIGENVLNGNKDSYIHVHFDNRRDFDWDDRGEYFTASMIKDDEGNVKVIKKTGESSKTFLKLKRNAKKLQEINFDELYKTAEDFTNKAREYSKFYDEVKWDADSKNHLKIDENDVAYKGIHDSLPDVDGARVRINGEDLEVTRISTYQRPSLYNKYGESRYDELTSQDDGSTKYTYDLISGPDRKEFWDEQLRVRIRKS